MTHGISIFRALGIKSVPYIPQVVPSMIKVIRSIIKEIDVKYQGGDCKMSRILNLVYLLVATVWD